MDTEEEWRDVVGWEGYYHVSSLGRVRRVAPGRGATVGRILKAALNPQGYFALVLFRDTVETHRSIHSLVAEAFLPPRPTPDHEVNHKYGIKTDNRASELEWVTHQENMQHSYDVLGRLPAPSRGEENGMARFSDEEVIEIRSLYATGEYTQVELAAMKNVHPDTIYLIVHRKTWKHI